MTGRLSALFLMVLSLSVYAAVPDAAPAAPCSAGRPLTVGVFPRRNPVTTDQMFAPLAEHLARRLDCPVRLLTAKDFEAFWRGVEERRYDLVHYNQYHYVRSSDRYRVILHNEEFGSGSIAGALYVRRDGPRSVDRLRGAKVVFGGGPDAMMSHIVPRFLLLQHGLGPDDYSGVYALNPPNAVLSVYYGQADAAGGGDVVGRLPGVTRLVEPGALDIIARSEPLRHLPWAVRADLPRPLADAIRAALLALNGDAAGRAVLQAAGLTGIAPAVDADYDGCRTIIEAVAAVVPLH